MKTSKLRVIGLFAGNSTGTGDFTAQMASNTENVSIWWRHHDKHFTRLLVSVNYFDGWHSWDVQLSQVDASQSVLTRLDRTVLRADSHYGDVMMGAIASQITSLTIVYSIVYSDADQRKHHSSASLAFVWGIHRGPVNSPHKGPVTRKMFPFDDVIMIVSHQKSATDRYPH